MSLKSAKALTDSSICSNLTYKTADVYSAYEENKDWHKELAEVTAEIGGGILGSFLANFGILVLLNPFTDSAIIVIGVGIASSVLGGIILQKIVDTAWSAAK